MSWYKEETGRTLTQGQISQILSDKYSYLDDDNRRATELGARRHYKGEWPELEATLFE